MRKFIKIDTIGLGRKRSLNNLTLKNKNIKKVGGNNMKVSTNNNRLVFQGVKESRTGNQKEGIAILKGAMATVQLKLGLAERVTVDGRPVVINKHSRNKWIARTTNGSGVNNISRFSNKHRIIDTAITNSANSTMNILTLHAKAQSLDKTYGKHDFSIIKNTQNLFQEESAAVAQDTASKSIRRQQVTLASNKKEAAANKVATFVANSIMSAGVKEAAKEAAANNKATSVASSIMSAGVKEATNRIQQRLENTQIVPNTENGVEGQSVENKVATSVANSIMSSGVKEAAKEAFIEKHSADLDSFLTCLKNLKNKYNLGQGYVELAYKNAVENKHTHRLLEDFIRLETERLEKEAQKQAVTPKTS